MELTNGRKGDGAKWFDARDLKKFYNSQQRASLEVLYSLADAVDSKIDCTVGHSKRTTEYATIIASVMGVKKKDIDAIKLGGPLHDIGRIVVKDEIISKPGKLTEDEFTQVKIHPEKGFNMIEKLNFLGDARFLTLHHHERFDGKGYPYGLKGEEIPLGVRIFSVADAIDAMTSNRPYRKALDMDTVLKELDKCSGTQFDPGIVSAFLKTWEQKPEQFHDLLKPKDVSTYLDVRA